MNTRNYRVILLLLCVALLGGLWGCREPLPTQTPDAPLISATTTSAPEASPEPSATQPRPSATQAPSVEANATAMPTQAHTPHPTAAPGALAAEAQAAAEQGDWERALGLWQEAIAKASDDERGAWQVALARTLVRAGRGSEALAPLEAALTESPDGPAAGDAWGLVGSLQQARGNWGAAIEAFQQHLARDVSAEAYVRWQMARCYMALDDSEAQLEQLAGVELAELPVATQAEILEERAEAQMALERYEEALASYDMILAISVYPDYVALIRHKRGEVLAAAGRTHDAAAEWLAMAIEQPTSRAAALALDALDKMGAGPSLTKLERGEILYYAGRYNEALTALQDYLKGDVSLRDRALYFMGLVQTRLAHYSAAYDAFDAVIGLEPPSALLADAWFAKARAAQAAGGDPAELYLEFALRYPTARAAAALWEAASTLEYAREWGEAGRVYQELHTLYPHDSRAAEAWYREGLAHYALGDKASAYAVWSDALTAAASAGERARLRTWLGLAAPSPADALIHWRAGAEEAPEAYYGLRAHDLAAGMAPVLPEQVQVSVPANGLSEADWNAIEGWIEAWAGREQTPNTLDIDRRVQRAHTLLGLNWRGHALDEYALLRQAAANQPYALLSLGRAAAAEQLHSEGIQIAERLLLLGRNAQAEAPPEALLRLAYPTAYGELVSAQSAAYGVDALLFLALVRQESRFDAAAVSYAGATGLTQVMPATGVEIAGRLNDSGYRQEMLTWPVVSVRYGVWYLSWLLDLCERDWVGALISYNAGYGRLRGWTGDGPIVDHDLLYETMTVEQPRLYVRRIYEGYAMYRALYAH